MQEKEFLSYLDEAFNMNKTKYGKIAIDNTQPLYFGRNTIEIDELGKFNKNDLNLYKGKKVFIKSTQPIKGLDLEYFKLYILKLKFKELYRNDSYILVEMNADNIEIFKEFSREEQIMSYDEYYAPYKNEQYLKNDKVKVYSLMNKNKDTIVASCIVIDNKLIEEIGVHPNYRYQGLSQVLISNILINYDELYLHCEEDVIPVYRKHQYEVVDYFEGFEAPVDISIVKNILG